MVEISLSGSGEGPGRATGRGYSTFFEFWVAKAFVAGNLDWWCRDGDNCPLVGAP